MNSAENAQGIDINFRMGIGDLVEVDIPLDPHPEFLIGFDPLLREERERGPLGYRLFEAEDQTESCTGYPSCCGASGHVHGRWDPRGNSAFAKGKS